LLKSFSELMKLSIPFQRKKSIIKFHDFHSNSVKLTKVSRISWSVVLKFFFFSMDRRCFISKTIRVFGCERYRGVVSNVRQHL
jgi:hypothetical protein